MRLMNSILLRMFGRPEGVLGKLGGIIMARTNRAFAHSVIEALQIQPNDKVLEVGFGPGVAIERLASLVSAGWIAGVNCSKEMVGQAIAQNAAAVERGLVDLRQGSVESLPFEGNTFDVALAINSMQVWSDVAAGLREIRRVLKTGGRIALGFTPYSGQSRAGLTEILSAADFAEARLVDVEGGFCALALKP